uniref:helicase associated domain-containing protein n=1 Tax=Streptomyces naphthomycinicus TaxID=2872625 RepID=UPI00288AAB4E
GGVLPDIAPGVLMDGDDLGRWLERQKQPATWKQLSTEQQQRLTQLGAKPAEHPAAGRAAKVDGKASGKAAAAFQWGLAALTQWVEREGQRPVPRGAVVEVAVDGEDEPVPVRLGVWVSNIKSRRDKLTQEQLDALRELGVQWV